MCFYKRRCEIALGVAQNGEAIAIAARIPSHETPKWKIIRWRNKVMKGSLDRDAEMMHGERAEKQREESAMLFWDCVIIMERDQNNIYHAWLSSLKISRAARAASSK